MEKLTKLFVLVCSFIAIVSFAGCSYFGFFEETTIHPDGSMTTETVWDADVAQDTAEKIASAVDTVAVSTGTSGNPFAIILSGVLTLVTGGLGIVANWQRRDKNNLLQTLKSTVKAAGDILENEKVADFVSTVKQIQDENNTREVVKNSLTTDENIAALK